MRFKEALGAFLMEDRAPSTNATYKKVLGRALEFLGDRDVDLITKEDVLRYVKHMRERTMRYETHGRRPSEQGGLSPKTIEQHVKSLTTFFRWMVVNGHRSNNPIENLQLRRYQRPPGSTKAATQKELQSILKIAEAKAVVGHPKHLAIFLFLADTGCRAGEAASMVIGNLSLEAGSAWVLGKGDKLRPVFFGSRTGDALRQWLMIHPKPIAEETVFLISSDSISQVISRLAQQAGIERPIGSHAIRHAVANAWKLAKVNMEAIQLKLGHDDVVTTMKMYGNTEWDYVRHQSHELALAAIEGPRPTAFTLSAPKILPGSSRHP
ncbi:MAG: tyrosine-type recombinase/integrase [Chloroflexi bacterium]|nr:tyrosine-type recombinase/integrase [Chloroflexota bacterium]